MFKPRLKQIEVLKYSDGKMGVSAVPGSGKTQTLSFLAANILAEGRINDDQEVLIVTLVNSAVNNFSGRISSFMQNFGLLPNLGYRVLTLHSLANQIVQERPDLIGLDNQFQIIDEREIQGIILSSVDSWMHINHQILENWTKEDNSLENPKIRSGWQKALTTISLNFIRKAKDLRTTPVELEKYYKSMALDDPLLSLGISIYKDYQRALNFRSAVDFDDLIRFALLALQMDVDFLQRLQYRWPFILEDEAQDSSALQEEILHTLAGDDGNWVRVGDPNQAIYETFTTASPEYLKRFLKQPGVIARDLPNSGRSSLAIMALANELIRWTNENHPVHELRDALTEPFILPTPAGDPQPNPPTIPNGVVIYDKEMPANVELENVAKSIKSWLSDHPSSTVAALVPRNDRGAKLVEILQRENIPHLEILQTSQSTRETARMLAEILTFIQNPMQTSNLVRVYENFDKIFFHSINKRLNETIQLLRSCPRLEEFLYPFPGKDWLQSQFLNDSIIDPLIFTNLESFRQYLVRWQAAVDLPIDQLILTIGQDIFSEPADLALSHRLALVLEQTSHNHPDWLLPDFVAELKMIAENRRKMFGFQDQDTGFDPDLHKGKAIITTYHKAKGLEWDRVYLLSVNTYDFPSAQQSDNSISEKYFYKDSLNLEAEILARLEALAQNDIEALYQPYGKATDQARIDYAAERLRLLFVGITRARTELTITWNSGDPHRKGAEKNSASIPLIALKTFLETQNEALP
ncbi:MAG: hypothetical protein BGO78_16435 [Chloroflexi bacterium 44-23]|nr:MAG: hypothetical protein BGO78_16435 [Chloroflexi bacterium 44-23]